eukprot:gb/GECH01012949.1/.p1 GENE.gb/GECH01012949.1/~~gb/GECH01012949.1/.p1  ORF type:complete len:142 (+),score=9.20 gb/GECH01012949.1/:1-426(+)
MCNDKPQLVNRALKKNFYSFSGNRNRVDPDSFYETDDRLSFDDRADVNLEETLKYMIEIQKKNNSGKEYSAAVTLPTKYFNLGDQSVEIHKDNKPHEGHCLVLLNELLPNRDKEKKKYKDKRKHFAQHLALLCENAPFYTQ